MRYPLVCMSKALAQETILVATANSYGSLWL